MPNTPLPPRATYYYLLQSPTLVLLSAHFVLCVTLSIPTCTWKSRLTSALPPPTNQSRRTFLELCRRPKIPKRLRETRKRPRQRRQNKQRKIRRGLRQSQRNGAKAQRIIARRKHDLVRPICVNNGPLTICTEQQQPRSKQKRLARRLRRKPF